MSVLVISAVDPYPTDAGKKVVLAGFLEYFTDCYGPDDVHYVKVGTPPKRDFPVTLHSVPGPSGSDVLRNAVTKVTTGRASLQEAFLGSPQTQAAIHRIIDEVRPQLQVYDTVRMAQYAPDPVAAEQICYLDDLFSQRYDRMIKATALHRDVEISPLGNFAEHVPPLLRQLGASQTVQTSLLRAERALVRRSEDRTARAFRRCLLVNAEEATVLTQRTGVSPGRVRGIPPLVTTPTSRERRYHGAPQFVFLGLLSLPHNDDGLRSFLLNVWPAVLARMPDAHLRVIGRDARPDLVALTRKLADSVTAEGYVTDLGEALGEAAALINPLRFGSGVKIKVIEALSRSLPVVSTPVGAEGIAAGPGTGVLIGQEPDEIADLLWSLTDPERNAEFSTQAWTHFQTTYSRQAVFTAYDAAFGLKSMTREVGGATSAAG